MNTKYASGLIALGCITIISIIIGIFYFSFKPSHTTVSPSPQPTSVSLPNLVNHAIKEPTPQPLNCEASGQQPDYASDGDLQQSVASGPVYSEGKDATIIARLLKKNPLIVEILDTDPWTNFVDEALMVKTLSVRTDAIDELGKLTFGELFEAKQYVFLAGGGIELGMGIGIYDVKPLPSNQEFYHPDVSRFPTANRNGILLKYNSIDSGALTIFHDGRLFYKDPYNNTQSGVMLPSEMNTVLESLRTAHFNDLKSDDLDQYSPGITLICKRYQKVPLEGNEAILKPAVTQLNTILNNLQENFEIMIRYEQKKQIAIIDWPEDIPSLVDIPRHKEEALALYRKTGKVQNDHLAYTKTPPTVLNSLSDMVNTFKNGPFYQSGRKVYMVTQGTCMQGANVCKSNTLYALQISELNSSQNTLNDLNIWPDSIGLTLQSITPDGLLVDRNLYSANRSFFDLISLQGKSFIEGSVMYEGVRLVKTTPADALRHQDSKPYLMKIYSKNKIYRWTGNKPLSYFGGMHTKYIKSTRADDEKFIELKQIIPQQIAELLSKDSHIYFQEKDIYYSIDSLSNPIGDEHVTIFISALSQTSYKDSTGYKIWNDREISLANVPAKGVYITEKQYKDNQMLIQVREDKYYIEGDYLYILDITNEPGL